MGLVLEQCLHRSFGLHADCIPNVLPLLEEQRAVGGAAPLGGCGIGLGHSYMFILSQGNILIDETGFITGIGTA